MTIGVLRGNGLQRAIFHGPLVSCLSGLVNVQIFHTHVNGNSGIGQSFILM